MTVKELIAKLNGFPLDQEVFIQVLNEDEYYTITEAQFNATYMYPVTISFNY